VSFKVRAQPRSIDEYIDVRGGQFRVLEHIRNLSEDPTHAARAQAQIPAWMATSHATCRCTRPVADRTL
jgi:hypothetical protein